MRDYVIFFKRIVVCQYSLFILFMSWTSVGGINEWLRLPNIFLLTSNFFFLCFILLYGKVSKRLFTFSDLFLLAFVFYLSGQTIIFGNEKSVNYLLAYCYVIFGVYFLTKLIIDSDKIYRYVLTLNLCAVLIVVLYILVVFILEVSAGVNLQNLLPRLYDANAIPRAYGFSVEPAYVAQYLNAMSPLAIWTASSLKKYKKWLVGSIAVLCGIGLILTFSSGGMAFLCASLLIAFFLFKDFRKLVFRKINYIILMLLILIAILMITDTLYILIDAIKKILFQTGGASESERINAWNEAIEIIRNSPIIGMGPGYMSSLGDGSGVLSWYLSLLVENGLIGFVLMFYFLGVNFYKVLKLNVEIKIPLFIGFSTVSMHLLIVANWYDPWLWVLSGLIFSYWNIYERK